MTCNVFGETLNLAQFHVQLYCSAELELSSVKQCLDAATSVSEAVCACDLCCGCDIMSIA